MTWEPLSVREGQREVDGPYDGVPEHLKYPLRVWLEGALVSTRSGSSTQLAVAVATRLRITLSERYAVLDQVLRACEADDELFLDAIDLCLFLNPGAEKSAPGLDFTLRLGASIWAVGSEGTRLERKVLATTSQASELARRPVDVASDELTQAWEKALGRSPDPSDAWDHAIKAVETVLIPIVVPNKSKPTLGDVLGQLHGQKQLWRLGLRGDSSDEVDTLVSMLRLMWPNPDRHGGAQRRTPLLPEAQAIVFLAVTIVQWSRDGILSRR